MPFAFTSTTSDVPVPLLQPERQLVAGAVAGDLQRPAADFRLVRGVGGRSGGQAAGGKGCGEGNGDDRSHVELLGVDGRNDTPIL